MKRLTNRQIDLIVEALDWTIGQTRWESKWNPDHERRPWFASQTEDLEETKQAILSMKVDKCEEDTITIQMNKIIDSDWSGMGGRLSCDDEITEAEFVE